MHQQLGAHEVMEAHEVLTDIIDGINRFMLYRPHVRDQQLQQILDKQVNYMEQEYNNMVSLLSRQRGVPAEPYQSRINAGVKYGLRNPSPVTLHESLRQLDDRDVASGMLGCAKASAVLRMAAGLECADPQLRRMVIQGAVSSAEMAYETFSYMNQRGMYQVPAMPMRTESNFLGSYQTGNVAPQAMTRQATAAQGATSPGTAAPGTTGQNPNYMT
ncbi:MAG: spore coat protein [Peptococcaceae bacterium]|nr:spore coat protein [Peptococcaceae bacterium]